jgi:signal transduction histidine kinase
MSDRSTKPPGIFSARVLVRLAIIFVPLVLITGGIVLALYHHDRALEHQLYEQAGEHAVKLQAEIINGELKTVQSDLLYLAKQAILVDFVSGGPTSKEQLETEYCLFARQRAVYDQIRYLDAGGQEQIRVNFAGGSPTVVPREELQPKGNRYYFWATRRLGRGEVFISPFDLNIEHDQIEQPYKPVIRFATPVFDRKGQKQGILILNYLGAGLTFKLAEMSVSFSGWSALLNRGGYFLRGRSMEDEWGFMLGHQTTFATYYPEEWPRLTESTTGQFETEQGLFTFRSLSPGQSFPAPGRPPDSTDPDAGDPGMIVVSHIPADRLNQQTNLLLQRLLVFAVAALLLVFGLTWYLAYAAAVRRHQERQIVESESRLRKLSTQLMATQEQERRKLSRDLHDELGQVVTAISLGLQRAAQAGNAAKKDELIAQALRGTELLLTDIREISARIRPTILDDLGLKDAVQSLLGDFERHTGIVPQSELYFEQLEVPAAVAENVYRILQEALTNVSKHAGAAEVLVELRVDSRNIFLAVRDRGAGFVPEALTSKGLGILGMRERAELLHGNFSVRAAPGEGTEITVTIPIQEPGVEADLSVRANR